MPHPMTDKEAELLRDVAEAARGWQTAVLEIFPRSDDEREAYEVFDTALHNLDAYRAQPQEAEGEMVTLGLMRSRPSGRLSATLKPDQEDPRHWEHVCNLVFRMPPNIVLPTIPAKVEP